MNVSPEISNISLQKYGGLGITDHLNFVQNIIHFGEHRLPLETVWQQTRLLAFSLHSDENDIAGYEKTFLQL